MGWNGDKLIGSYLGQKRFHGMSQLRDLAEAKKTGRSLDRMNSPEYLVYQFLVRVLQLLFQEEKIISHSIQVLPCLGNEGGGQLWILHELFIQLVFLRGHELVSSFARIPVMSTFINPFLIARWILRFGGSRKEMVISSSWSMATAACSPFKLPKIA